jgi:ribosomal-protein-alanine N-acetyltransferase
MTPPYDVYDMVGVNPEELLESAAGAHAVMAGDRLIGFPSFGPDGQVPGWDYDDSALDTGGGLRPELTGLGLGRFVIAAGLAFGCAHFRTARVPGDRRLIQHTRCDGHRILACPDTGLQVKGA